MCEICRNSGEFTITVNNMASFIRGVMSGVIFHMQIPLHFPSLYEDSTCNLKDENNEYDITVVVQM